MDKQQLVSLLKEYGDATVNYRGQKSSKPKYTVCTINLDEPYIKAELAKGNKNQTELVIEPGKVMVWAWDSNNLKSIDPAQVTSVVPMSAMLKNER